MSPKSALMTEPVFDCRGMMNDKDKCPLQVSPLSYKAGTTLTIEIARITGVRDTNGAEDTSQNGPESKEWKGPTEFCLTCDNGHTFDYSMQAGAPGSGPRESMEGQIDKVYWRKEGAELVEGAYKRVVAHMDTMGAYVKALLTGYALSTLFETYHMQLDSIWYAIALAVPYAVIGYAQYQILSAPVPDKLSELDPESWVSCKAVKEENLHNAMERLKHVKWWTHISAVLMIFVTVAVAALAQDRKNDTDAAKKKLDKKTVEADSLSKVVAAMAPDWSMGNMSYVAAYKRLELSGNFPPKIHVDVLVTGRKNNRDTLLLATGKTLADDGKFDMAWAPIVKTDTMRVRFKFRTSDKVERTIEKDVAVKDQ